MFDNLSVRNKLLAVAAIPVNTLVIAALWSAVAGQVGLAILAAGGAAGTMVTATLTARSIAQRSAAIAAAANELAMVGLPALMSDLSLPSSLASSPSAVFDGIGVETLTGHQEDELGQLAHALGTVKTQARLLVEQERDAISAKFGSIVRELARRNQSLLDHQIGHIDWLEAAEEDPERLEHLFELDHLTTRMRRASESILVLSGADPTPQAGGPAPVLDVLRSAMGETMEYRNIRLDGVDGVDGVMVAAGAASDLANLLAEVLENANQFSPPGSVIELRADNGEDGSLRVTVVDRGVGMGQRGLAAANAMVADAPEINLSIGNSIGFVVIGLLARRLEATVQLTATAGSGVTVTITVPESVLNGSGRTGAVPAAAGTTGEFTPEPTLRRPPAELAPEPASPLGRLLGIGTDGLPASAVGAEPLRAGGGTPAVPGDRDPDRARSGGDLLAALIGGPARTIDPAPLDPAPLDAGPLDAGPLDPAPDALHDPTIRPAETLAEAIPTGAAFDTGVDGLLYGTPEASAVNDDSPEPHTVAAGGESYEAWTPPTVEPAAGTDSPPMAGWEEPGTVAPPPNPDSSGPGFEIRASARVPDEVRSMISRYRDGLKGTGHRQPTTDPSPPTAEPSFDVTALSAGIPGVGTTQDWATPDGTLEIMAEKAEERPAKSRSWRRRDSDPASTPEETR